MANIINNNFQNIRLNVNNDEYWDFFLNKNLLQDYSFSYDSFNKNHLCSYIDVEKLECIDGDFIKGFNKYIWEHAKSSEYVLENVGYTSFDNGLFSFRKDRILNKDFVELYKNTKYTIKDEKILKLHKVTGSTQVYEYPLSIENSSIKLNGGFYQGFFKTECDKYQVLPSKLDNGDTWAYEFVLQKKEHKKESEKTLNDAYPNNKGIFFYIGTRAENKWVYFYDKEYKDECLTCSYDDYIDGGEIDEETYGINNLLDVSLDFPYEDIGYFDNYVCDEETCPNYIPNGIFFGEEYLASLNYFDEDECCNDEYVEEEIDISNIKYMTDGSFSIKKYEENLDTDNKYLLFNRTNDGFNVNNWEDGLVLRYINERNTFNENLFLLMDRTKSGYTVNDIDELKKQFTQSYDIYKDLYNNALAFRITDEGAIGYRYLIRDCDSDEKYKIIEGYSKNKIIPNEEWCVVHTKIQAQHDTMVIRFYVNGSLVFVSDELPKLNLKTLDDVMDKQETVPFNISIGGGTQGLCDVILPNYMIEPYRKYPLEKHFGGSFIGYLKSFKFYEYNFEMMDIKCNFLYENNKFVINKYL